MGRDVQSLGQLQVPNIIKQQIIKEFFYEIHLYGGYINITKDGNRII